MTADVLEEAFSAWKRILGDNFAGGSVRAEEGSLLICVVQEVNTEEIEIPQELQGIPYEIKVTGKITLQ